MMPQGERDEMDKTAQTVFDEVRANTHCTLFNRYVYARVAHYKRTVIRDVSWLDKKGDNLVASGGNLSINQAEILIPFARPDYLPSREWLALTDKDEYWTLQMDDIIVKGIVVDDLSSTFTVSDLERRYDQVLAIVSIDTMDKSVSLKHWKIGAK